MRCHRSGSAEGKPHQATMFDARAVANRKGPHGWSSRVNNVPPRPEVHNGVQLGRLAFLAALPRTSSSTSCRNNQAPRSAPLPFHPRKFQRRSIRPSKTNRVHNPSFGRVAVMVLGEWSPTVRRTRGV